MSASQKNSAEDLPLVLIVNCIHDCGLERDILKGVARVESINGFSREHVSLIEQATVIVVLSLHDLTSNAQSCLSTAELVVCIGSGNPQLEASLAEELRIQRLVHVNVQLVDEAADTTMALVLSLLRRTHILAASCARGVWAPNPELLRGARRCSGLTLGLLGLDNVALAVAQRAVSFGFNMVYYDPLKDRDREEATEWAQAAQAAGMDPVASVEELLATSDVISLHCGACEETKEILNAETAAHFKEGAVLVNTSSGELMQEDTIRCALMSGQLAGAGLDAVDGIAWFEAWVRDLPNLIMTPRCACYSDQAFVEQRSRGGVVIKRFLKEGALKMPSDSAPDPYEDPAAALPNSSKPARAPAAADVAPELTKEEADDAAAALPPSPSVLMAALGSAGGPKDAAAAEHFSTPPQEGAKEAPAPASPSPAAALAHPDPDPDTAQPHGSEEEGSACGDSFSEGGDSWTAVSMEGSHLSAGSSQIAAMCLGTVVLDPRYLSDGMVVALRVAGGGLVGSPRGEEAGDASPAAPTCTGEELEGQYFGLRFDAAKKDWKMEPVAGLTRADPATHLMVLRRKEYVGFRSGLADGRVLQLSKKGALQFHNHNFGAWESWAAQRGSEPGRLVLRNRKWKSSLLYVSVEVVAELCDGVVRYKY